MKRIHCATRFANKGLKPLVEIHTKHLSICLSAAFLICLLVLGGVALAQEDFLLESERASLSMTVPSGWETNTLDLYGIMSNSAIADANTSRMDVQVVFRKADDLLSVLNEPINMDAENPAEDYLFKYASRYSERLQGTYDLPQPFVTEDGIPGAMMLFVERTQTLRLGQNVDAALSLSMVFALGDDDLLIVLIDGPAAAGGDLLSEWADILERMRLNNEPLPFADDVPRFLNQFESPESLLRRYEILGRTVQPTPANQFPLPGENLSITYADDTLLFSRYEGWSAEANDESDSMRLISDDEGAQIDLSLQRAPADFESAAAEIEAFAAKHETLALAGEPVVFAWGSLDAAIANLVAKDADFGRSGQIVIGRSITGDALLVMHFDAAANAPAQLTQDWRNTLTAIRLNGGDLPFEPLLMALARLPED